MKIAVYGIGNVLIGDDAVGPSIIRLLDALWEFPEGVVIEDLGTPSLDLAARLLGFDTVIFADAVAAKDAPGTIKRYDREAIVRHPPSLRLSPHDPSLKETLLTMDLFDNAPSSIVLIGIVPESLEQFGLTETVRAALPSAIDAVFTELAKYGVVPVRRDNATVPPVFWDAA